MKILLIPFILLVLSSCDKLNDEVHIGPNAILYNYDGDTFTLDCDYVQGFNCKNNKLRVRVKGVDTPEIKGECAYEKNLALDAKAFTRDELRYAGEIILVVNKLDKYDKYRRLLASVFYDGKSLSAGLIDNGLGRSYFGGPRSGWCN